MNKFSFHNLILPVASLTTHDDGDVTKFVSTFVDKASVESVIIPLARRTTLCVSSQSGCRMACAFCATGALGFIRNCTAEEIVFQVYAARFLMKRQVDNLVFMGMGEPLDNIDNVANAISILSDQKGFNIPIRRITVSTAGHIPGLRALAAYKFPHLRIAVSINAADNAARSSIMPINNSYPLDKLRKVLLEYPLAKRDVFFIEYILLNGVNDTPEMASKFIEFCEGLPVRINLIPYNPAGPSSKFSPSSNEQTDRFKELLVEKKFLVRVRRSQGSAVMAACGQLGGGINQI
jgi:23S rRNA (adenine2503-C2)-methyltransferase